MKKKNGRKAASDLNEVNFVNFPLLKQGRHKINFIILSFEEGNRKARKICNLAYSQYPYMNSHIGSLMILDGIGFFLSIELCVFSIPEPWRGNVQLCKYDSNKKTFKDLVKS